MYSLNKINNVYIIKKRIKISSIIFNHYMAQCKWSCNCLMQMCVFLTMIQLLITLELQVLVYMDKFYLTPSGEMPAKGFGCWLLDPMLVTSARAFSHSAAGVIPVGVDAVQISIWGQWRTSCLTQESLQLNECNSHPCSVLRIRCSAQVKNACQDSFWVQFGMGYQ